MLQIRKEQMAAFEKAMRQKFEDRMAVHIAEDFPYEYNEMVAPDGGDAKVREFIRAGIERAKGYRIRSEENIEMFLDLMLGLGPDFDERNDTRWTREFLEHPDLHEDVKMDTIYSELDEQQTAPESRPWERQA